MLLGLPERQAQRVLSAQRELLAWPVLREPAARMALSEQLGLLVLPERLVPRVQLARLVLLEQRVLQVHRVLQGLLEPQAPRVLSAQPELLDWPVLRGPMARMALSEQLALLALLEQRVLPVRSEQQVPLV